MSASARGRAVPRSALSRSGRQGRPTIGLTWVLFCAAVTAVAVAGLAWFAPELVGMLPLSAERAALWQERAGRVSQWAQPAMLVAGALAGLAGAAAWVAFGRRGQRDRVAVAVGAVTRSLVASGGSGSADSGAVRIRRTVLGRPRAVDLELPAHFAVDGLTARQDIEQAVARVLGGGWRGDWKDRRLRRGRVTLRAVPPAVTDGEETARDDKERVTLIARRVFGQEAAVKASTVDAEGRLTGFRLAFPPHPNLANPLFRDRVAASLTDLLPGLWEVRWDLEHDTMHADQRPVLDRVIPYRPVPVTAENALQLPVAAAAGRLEAAGWNLEGPTPHGLVTGETGGGKTYAFLVLAVELMRRGIPVFGVDPKMVELMALEGWPGFESLATDPEEMADVVAYLHDLMMWRYRLIRERKLRRSELWPVVLFLDELLILQDVLADHWAEEKAKKGIKGGREHSAVRQIVRMGALARTARIHLIVGVQRPQATLFPEGARDNFRFRLSLGRLTQEGALQMWGDPHLGTAVPPQIPGRGTISTPTGPREAQVFKLPELDLSVPDEDLSEQDAALRAQLLAECRDALTSRRPADPHLHIGGRTLPGAVTVAPPAPAAARETNGPAPDTGEAGAESPGAGEPDGARERSPAAPSGLVRLAASALSVGDHFLLEQDGDATDVEVVVEAVEEGDEQRVVIDYRPVGDGQPGQLEVDGDDQVPIAPVPED